MKVSRNFLVGFVLILGTINFSIAQEEVKFKKVEKKAVQKRHLHQPMSTLDLSEEQKVKIEQIRETYKKKLDAVKADTTLIEEERRSTYQTLRKEQGEEIRSVLTEDQKIKLKAQRIERKPNLKYQRLSSDEKAVQYVERMDKVVSLEDAQKEKLTIIYKNHYEKKQEIWKNSNLTEEAKKAEFKKIKEAKKESVSKVLTEQQIEALKKHKEARKAQKSRK